MDFSLVAMALAARLSGRILLAVEDQGRAWYVNPVNEERYSLGSPDDAWLIMRSLALGISNSDLAAPIPVRLAGRVLLAVEDHGKAYYVDPLTMKLYYLGRPADAFHIMSTLALGISNIDLAKIPMAISSAINPPPSTFTVQFTAQAPFGEWSDVRQQEGCEEASVFMAVKWARGESFTLDEAKAAIIGMSDWEKSTYGVFVDTSADDTAARLLHEYEKFDNYTVLKNIGVGDVKSALSAGKIVIVPVDARKLENPNYSYNGALRHMIVVIGYDASTDEFITNDPGTRVGGGYRYKANILQDALMDYPSGDHAPLADLPTAMITISRTSLF